MSLCLSWHPCLEMRGLGAEGAMETCQRNQHGLPQIQRSTVKEKWWPVMECLRYVLCTEFIVAKTKNSACFLDKLF